MGFFNSVPRQQILDSLSILVQMYSDRHYPSHISVCLKKQPNCESAWPGKPVAKGAKNIKFLHVSDLPAIVSMSCKAGVFTTLGLLFRQHRATCIGNQISPVLSSLPVIQRGSCWQREWNQFLSSAQFFSTKTSELFVCRYVDEDFLSHPCLKDFQHLSFYRGDDTVGRGHQPSILGLSAQRCRQDGDLHTTRQSLVHSKPAFAGSWSSRIQAIYPERPSLYSMPGLLAADQVNCRNFVDCT